MWSFLLCSCITPPPTSDHFLTKVLTCWHHKNLNTESLFQSEVYAQILLMWPWEYLVKHKIIVPIRAMLHINFLHHIENKDRTKCQPTRQHHTTDSFIAALPLCLKMKAQGWSIKNMLRSNSILNTQQQTRCHKDKVRNHKIPETVCKEGFSPSISNRSQIFLSLMSWKGDWDTEKGKQLP